MDPAGSDDRLVDVRLDQATIGSGTPDQDYERQIAAQDLLHSSVFAIPGRRAGPYRLDLALRDAKLALEVRTVEGEPVVTHVLSLTPFRTVLRDYLLLVDNHHAAARSGAPDRIEAIDMGRRGVHNEAAELLTERLKGKITADFDTMRRLFTLIAALHWRR